MNTRHTVPPTQNLSSKLRWPTLLAWTLLLVPMHLAAHSGHTDWGPWSFDWEVKDGAGMGIRNVYYKHELVIYKANMPVIRVRYDGNARGPYADRIDWGNLSASVSLCDPNTKYACCSPTPCPAGTANVIFGLVCQKEYWAGGHHWLQIGAYATIGWYRLNSQWLLSEDGYILPRLWSAGLQGNANHIHHPYWRIDFDVNGAASDQVFVFDDNRPNEGWGPGWHEYTQELNDLKNPATARVWFVRDNPTGHGVWIMPGSNDGTADVFSPIDVAPRLYHYPEEGVPWPFGAGNFNGTGGQLGYDNGENIAEKDVVFWYVSHLFHSATDNGCLWHWAGPTLKIQR